MRPAELMPFDPFDLLLSGSGILPCSGSESGPGDSFDLEAESMSGESLFDMRAASVASGGSADRLRRRGEPSGAVV